ncbi:2-isopropylmalate synthase [Pleionea sediminis]|uniref:2-isopropylmalate synthase n=1 Tax=Pleionea sediminis TaxID=2569479 RepID=UPI0011846DB6
MPNQELIIFDTTLRDGEQSPGASMSISEKVELALLLEELGVDVIEAGFAIASPGDFEAVQKIGRVVKNTRVCSLSRACKADIDRAAESLKYASLKRIHTFIATSDMHMTFKLNMDKQAVLQAAVSAVSYARQLTDDVEFSAEDGGRSDIDFLAQVVERVIDAGATTINIPDTVGYCLPHQFGQFLRALMEKVPNSDKAIFSVHCHNDLGLATANSLAAIENGARQVECTINGLGERAGNAALEEIVMAVKTRQDIFPLETHINTKNLVGLSQRVSQITGFAVQPNKSIVGRNAFAHEAGIHQDGILKHRETYEIMRAEDVGWTGQQIVLGKHSGRNAFVNRLHDLNVAFESASNLESAFEQFKRMADQGKGVTDQQLLMLAEQFNARKGVERA